MQIKMRAGYVLYGWMLHSNTDQGVVCSIEL